jgi:hypothetical protein
MVMVSKSNGKFGGWFASLSSNVRFIGFNTLALFTFDLKI